ncbi:hypothetical protein CPC197_0681A, partial [Chlamydia psittaci C1/97]
MHTVDNVSSFLTIIKDVPIWRISKSKIKLLCKLQYFEKRHQEMPQKGYVL